MLTSSPDRATDIQTSAYWYTIKDCQRVLRRSRATVWRYLPLVPPTERVLVKRRLSDRRATRYWRISPRGLQILGHATEQAPYL